MNYRIPDKNLFLNNTDLLRHSLYELEAAFDPKATMAWEWARSRLAGRLGLGAFYLPFIVPNYIVSTNNILYYRRHIPPTPGHTSSGAGQGGRYPSPVSAGRALGALGQAQFRVDESEPLGHQGRFSGFFTGFGMCDKQSFFVYSLFTLFLFLWYFCLFFELFLFGILIFCLYITFFSMCLCGLCFSMLVPYCTTTGT